MKGHTTFRVFLAWTFSFYWSARCAHQLFHTFPDLPKYGFYTNHPNFARMGKFWGTFTVLKYPLSNLFFIFIFLIENFPLNFKILKFII